MFPNLYVSPSHFNTLFLLFVWQASGDVYEAAIISTLNILVCQLQEAKVT